METPRERSLPLPLLFVVCVALMVALALMIFYGLLQPGFRDLRAMAAFLSLTAALSILAGHAAFRMGWWHQFSHLRWSLLAGYALSSVLMFINVWVTALLMFVSQHDLLLATVLLIFAGGVAMSLGYFISASVTARISSLRDAARAIADGAFSTQVPTPGRDEVTDLALTFNEMAEQLEEMAKKEQELDRLRRSLTAWVGHDLRQPLAAIRVVVEALADDVIQGREAQQRYLHTALGRIETLSALLDDLSELAEIEAGGLSLHRRAASLGDVISDLVEAYALTATRQGVEIDGHIANGVDPLVFDVRRIERVLSNLIENAIRHTPARGQVQIAARPTAEGVLVEVRDTGEGIAEEDLPHIFERFYHAGRRHDEAEDRAGLGLAIAWGLVEAHGGQLEVESEVGRGTRVWFVLPREPEERPGDISSQHSHSEGP